MKISNYEFPKSSFLSIDKDMNLIIDKIIKNKRLQKLLYYNSPDALDKPELTEDQIFSLFGKNVKLVPKLTVDGSVLNYIIVSFDHFTQSLNPEFRDNMIEFDIICHFDQWQLKDNQLRPYKIAAELDTAFNGQKLTGIGEVEFVGMNQLILTDEYAGLCLMFAATHGGEDEKKLVNPKENEEYNQLFDEMFNQPDEE